jgi:acetolactate synthase-1/2/3 large subunit
LHSAGARLLFGLPGGGANLDVVGAAAEAGIEFVLTHDETTACVAAGTYGLLTGSVGAALATRGPGVTNAVTGLAQANLDRFPLLLLSDTVPQASAFRVAHQRLDLPAMTAPLTKWSGTLGPTHAEEYVRKAVALARRAPAGAVHLVLDPTADGDIPPATEPCDPTPDSESAAARRLLAESRYPVVILGLEAARTPRAVRECLEPLGAPVLCTYQASGVVPDGHPLVAGLFTNGTSERGLLEQADLILGVGLDPVEPIPAAWNYPAPVVLLHPHPMDARYFGEPTVVSGPLETTLPALTAAAAPRWEAGAAVAHRSSTLTALGSPSMGLSPHELVTETARAAPAGSTVTVDAGAHMLMVMPLWPATRPHQVLISNGLATMGFALPAAIGAALARPDVTVVCFIGDGGLGMVAAELETITRLELDVVVVVFNDAALSLIEIKQSPGQGGTRAVRYTPTDFAAVAQSMGLSGCVVSTTEELRATLGTELRGPRLIDARVDPSGYPDIIAATRGYREWCRA